MKERIWIFAIALCVASSAHAVTLQERIDAAPPNDTIRVETGLHAGAIVISKPLRLIGDQGAEIDFVLVGHARCGTICARQFARVGDLGR